MKTFKLTTLERVRIRSWLEKRPGSSDLPKVWDFDREDGGTIQISRVTQYFGQDWKVRIAFIVETNYPILMSTPIPAGKDSKGTKPGKMVPKNYATEPDADGKVTFKVHVSDDHKKHLDIYKASMKKVKKNKGAFALAVAAEMHALEQHIKQTGAL